MTDKLKLYEERVQRMKDAIELREPDRVPILSQIDNWALSYYGTTLQEALKDVELEYKAYSKALTDFPFDGALAGGITFPLNFVHALGGGIYNNQTETLQIATGHSEIMSVDEYDQLIADPIKFIRDTLLPRKHKIFQEGTVQEKFGKYAHAVSRFLQYAQSRGMMAERYKQEHGLPIFNNGACGNMPADAIMDYLRDFKGIMRDIKICPDKLAAACDALLPLFIRKTFGTAPQPADDRYVQLFLHLPQFIRAKEFEKVYWPSFKKYVDTVTARGHKIVILFEKNWEHLYEYIQELPKGSILGCFEEDDLRKAKKILGKNMCIAGGLKTNDLCYATKEKCIDIVKGLIDDLAPGGGFVLTTDKGLISINDAKPENLRAVTEFAVEYGAR
ncbi:hypothetical protein E4K67_26855 [Desulfosporosinus fructosivorans]|uniref:Uroporphyrinogen decarboxylase (URO-D) domain-containing protein n=1 Tax=Desulfosporosinus fructosivorans TaxID=2018669 RepID=A0A4Z0QYI7_9FIRM|nr:uroporphyrinogen decarboxylase family protein [Desulfosporosinus fructosivorans]TGE35115.1 hypothetical protein E4K67_26855 [Desulfosporosinus fructosivorans]